jgi:phosphatidylglycerol:prolipoprotein diacylglycerol transferase
MSGPFVHEIDPVIGQVGGLYLWWYGVSYGLGFLEMHLWMRRQRARLGLGVDDVYRLSVWFAAGVLIGGRAIEIAFDEWPFYRDHVWLMPALWLGGMATHGLLIGGATGVWLFSRRSGIPFLGLADELVIPGAFLMAVGRVGNFIDGQIVGSVTGVPWAVQFPDAEGFRHPVVLYDAVKNLALIPLLLWVRRSNPPPGTVAAHFVFWYPFLRFFVDLARDYPTHRLALGTGQTLNIVMALVGVLLLARLRLRPLGRRGSPPSDVRRPATPGLRLPRLALATIIALSVTIPSNWTQDVPARYGARHAGLTYSRLYPRLDTRPKPRTGAVRPRQPRRPPA